MARFRFPVAQGRKKWEGGGERSWVSQYLSSSVAAQFGNDSLRYSTLAGTGFYILAALLFFRAANFLENDWED